MKREVPGSCPMCGGEITVTEIKCKKCKSVIQGEFDLCKFCRLNEIEKELGISYPTVRNKLDEVISVLGHKVEKPAIDKKAILEKLQNGEISKDEALKLLSGKL